ncbi:unnamed protein product [Symbiodinium sp. CCMP2592]|nr:unnamed protein product [Symbiodinium sp. CCMP2592]
MPTPNCVGRRETWVGHRSTMGHRPSLSPPAEAQHVRENLYPRLGELVGKTLVVDAATNYPSEGDVLAGLIFEFDGRAEAVPAGKRQVLLSDSSLNRPQARFTFTKESVAVAVRKLFPAIWLEGCAFPFVKGSCECQGVFLGLEHDLSTALTEGFVTFWVREKLFTKLNGMIQHALNTQALRAGQASKMFGLLNFLGQGIYGRVGRGGLAALADRQQSSDSHLTQELRDCFQVVKAIVAMKPCRQFWVVAPPEAPRQGTGGFLLVWQRGRAQCWEGFVAAQPARLYGLWSSGEKKIAQMELSMVLFALVARPNDFRNRRGVWYLDNTSALMSLIRGRSDSANLSRLSKLIHLCLYAYQTWVYWEWEWVPSKLNCV